MFGCGRINNVNRMLHGFYANFWMGSEHQGHSLTVSPPWLPVRRFSGQCVSINYNKPAVLLQCFSATLSNRLYFFPVPLFVAFEIKRCNLDTSSPQIITHLQGHFFCHLCLNPSEDKPLRSAAVLSGLSGLRREVILSATIAGRRLAARQLYT